MRGEGGKAVPEEEVLRSHPAYVPRRPCHEKGVSIYFHLSLLLFSFSVFYICFCFVFFFDGIRIRAQFEEELGEMPQDEWEHHRRAKASAWYVVTYAEEFRAKQPGTSLCLFHSFANLTIIFLLQ